jgi:hypothetical protein
MINPWDDFDLNIKNFNIKKEEAKTVVEQQIEETSESCNHMIFTDGSSIPESRTSSAAILNQSHPVACRLSNEHKASAFEAEVFAIKLGVNMIVNRFYNINDSFQSSSKKINLFIDNQATILTIAH